MKKTILILAAAALAAGCHDSSGSRLSRDQQNYGVVQEGATGAATSTLNAPGEATPPMTATNVDTTSNLTLLPGTATAAGQPGTIAGTMTGSQSGSMNVGYANDGSIATPRTRVARPVAPRVVSNQSTTHSEPGVVDTTVAPMTSAAPARPTSQPTATTATESPAATPSTDTASTTPTETSDQKPKDTKPPEPPPSTDTSTTTAPPPTQT